MTRDTPGAIAALSQSASALDALLSAEREIAERLAQADAEASRIVDDAHARIAAREAAMRATLQSELAAAADAQRESSARRETSAAERDARERHRLDGVTDTELIVLADVALSIVWGLDSALGGRGGP